MNKHVEPPVRLGARAAEPAVRRAPTTAPVRTSSDRFRAANRHSRLVRFFRWALPTGVIGALGLTLAVNYLDPFSIAVDLPFDLGRISLSGTQVKMEFPRLHGFTSDNRGYSVTAEAAFQDLTKPNAIELQKIEAKLEMADNGWAALTAATGNYDTKTEQMKLGGGVRIDTSSGYGGLLADAAIDIRGGKLTSQKPVELTYLDGKLTADSIEVVQKDSRALLVGNVRLDFKMPPAGDSAKNGDAKGADAKNSTAAPSDAKAPDAKAPIAKNHGMPASAVPTANAGPPVLRGTAKLGATP